MWLHYIFSQVPNLQTVLVFSRPGKNRNVIPEIHNFVKYLVNWVAGTKLIFILLLIVILYTADEQSLVFTSLALIISIASFYWRLFPLIRKMDRDDQIEPNKYSAVLGWMILAFILIFLIAIFVSVGG